MQPQVIDAVDRAFPAHVSKLMPKYDEIPEEFTNFNIKNKWQDLFNDWFYCGLSKLEVKPKPGIDKDVALIHIQTIMRSFEPKHEHKTAACAFLMSEWFEDATWERKKK